MVPLVQRDHMDVNLALRGIFIVFLEQMLQWYRLPADL